MHTIVNLTAVLLTMVVVCAVTIGTLWGFGWRPARMARVPDRESACVLLFEGNDLVDVTPRAEEILAQSRSGSTDWARMLSAFACHFPGLAEQLDEVDSKGTVGLRSVDGTEHLVATSVGERIRITITGGRDGADGMVIDAMAFRSILRELETLRRATDGMPFLVWRETASGEIVWANRAYLRAVGDEAKETWPPPGLFGRDSLSEVVRGGTSRRLEPRSGMAGARVYECRVVPVGADRLFSAVGIDAAVAAEHQLRDFMQALTNTFSHLTTGLAIFDRQRRLAMFNPALTDLTSLPVDFLASRPTLYNFLDRLRDRRMVPEPKDYGSWRQQIAELEAATLDGTYSETWSLPDNRTYRVTGRPHHGGALAFLIEDISSEMTLTRRFRSELELGQAVIDALDAAVAVFSPGGDLSIINMAYQELWGCDIADTIEIPTVTELSRVWMARSASPVWGEIREFVLHTRERTNWGGEVDLGPSGTLDCRVAPLAGGSTLVSFQLRTEGARRPLGTALSA